MKKFVLELQTDYITGIKEILDLVYQCDCDSCRRLRGIAERIFLELVDDIPNPVGGPAEHDQGLLEILTALAGVAGGLVGINDTRAQRLNAELLFRQSFERAIFRAGTHK
jgi:hypothetical protein